MARAWDKEKIRHESNPQPPEHQEHEEQLSLYVTGVLHSARISTSLITIHDFDSADPSSMLHINSFRGISPRWYAFDSVKWPCSSWVSLVGQWIERPSAVRGFDHLSGTQIFTLSHARVMLFISPFTNNSLQLSNKNEGKLELFRRKEKGSESAQTVARGCELWP